MVARDRTDTEITGQLGMEESILAVHSSWIAEVVGPAVGIVGAIRDWVPLDVEAVERGFRQFLDHLDQLLLTESGSWLDRAYEVLPAIYVVIGVQAFAMTSLRRIRPDLNET